MIRWPIQPLITGSGQQDTLSEDQMAKSDLFPQNFLWTFCDVQCRKPLGQKWKGQWFYWSLSYLPSITFTLDWTILGIPSTEAGCLSTKCGIPTSIFWLLIIPYFFSIFAFKSLSKISPFIIKSFVWIQKNTQDLDLVKRERKRTLKHLVVCTMFCS